MRHDDEDEGTDRPKRAITDAFPALHIETRKAQALASADLVSSLIMCLRPDHSKTARSCKPRATKMKMVISLAKVHLGVDVIGLILSHGHDLVFDANRPLDDVGVQVSLFAHASGDAFVDFSASGGGVLCSSFHKRPTTVSQVLVQNAFVVAKLYRDQRHRHNWLFDPILEAVTCPSHCLVGLTRALQLYLLDIIPDIDIPNVTSLKTIQGICSTLTSAEFLALEALFPAKGTGLSKSAFAECLAFGILKSRPELRTEKRTTSLLRLLCEMFDQIDINGDEVVDWDEFTSFCVALGMLSTKQQQLPGDGKASGVEYTYKQLHTPHTPRPFPYHITKMRTFDYVRKVAILEHESPLVAIFDMDGSYLHDITNVMKTSVMKDGLYILDIDHIPARNCYVVSSSDRVVTLWNIVNAVKGQYVQSGRFVHHHMMRTLKWCPGLKLCMASSTKHAVLLNLDSGKIEHRLTGHGDLITDIVEVPDAPLFLTSSYDHKVALWEMDRMRAIFAFKGHTQGVLHVDCIGNVLVSSGFEHHARVWSLATRKQLVMLTGHHHMLLNAKLVRTHPTSLVCVTGDVAGNFKVWDISRCIVDASKDAAVVEHIFNVAIPGCVSPVFHAFAVLPQDHKTRSSIEPCEIWTGTVELIRVVPETVSSLQAPAQHVLYNSLAHTFTADVGGKITVWSGKDGLLIEEPITITNVEVCGLCYDLPRQRKLFISTSDGYLHMFNLITGVPMHKMKVHDGEILTMIYCERTNCLVTNGIDDTLSICADVPGEGRLDPLRTIESVHRATMTACAYSTDHGVIVTGDVKGHIRVHDFQRLSLCFRCEGHSGEITALAFHPLTCVLFAADVTGEIWVWQLMNVLTLSQCIMRLTLPVEVPGTFLTSGDEPRGTPSISALTAVVGPKPGLVAADDAGTLHYWPLPLLRKHAKGIAKLFFEPLPPNMVAYARGGYNPNLRITRMQSVAVSEVSTNHHHHKPVMGRPTTLTVAAAMSWVGHRGKISSVTPLPLPGFVFSADDAGVKLWSFEGECLGSLERKFDDGAVGPSKGSDSTPWKFRLTPTSTALEMSATVQTMTKNVLAQIGALSVAEATPVAESDMPKAHRVSLIDTRHARTQSYRRCSSLTDGARKPRMDSIVENHFDPALHAILQKAIADAAFSRRSLAEGIKRNVFTQEEGFALECLSHDEHARQTYDSIVFPPLLLSKGELRRKLAAEMPAPQLDAAVDELPMLRTCDHFLAEIQTHKEKAHRFAPTVDLEPSTFLQTHLPSSTAAKKPMQWKLDGFVAQLPAVARSPTPKATPYKEAVTPKRRQARQWADPIMDALDARLESSLGPHRTLSMSAIPQAQANISRKLTLCKSLQGTPKATRAASPPPLTRRTTTLLPSRPPVLETIKAGGNPFGPFYSPKEVLEFGDTLLRFDKDLSGDIDIDEWLKIMTAFVAKTKAFDVAMARDLFVAVDDNDDGLISHQELLHIVFMQATKDQLMLMEELIRASQERSLKSASRPSTAVSPDATEFSPGLDDGDRASF
ncbi:hypothetical protein ACHHYP_01467 [Achlya hypogyna]|uniref:EF-hand domain-containing protein n=1 Tax=Achlya hypogyna TaxID=1202772 RepID=A0A1V9Z8V0_ACHHY|nr:hypothetical protein ACHHYP_01467 [Achlya hypogyna]